MGPPPGGSLLHGVDWVVKAGVADEVIMSTGIRVRRLRRRRLNAVVGLVAVALIGGLWLSNDRHSAQTTEASATARVNLPERKTLPDGSVVDLKDGSLISVIFTPKFRRVILVSGEAHFKVAKNKERPFVVAVEDVEVRAVGTAFSVQRGKDNVEVLVTEGRVALNKLPVVSSAPGTVASPDSMLSQTFATLGAGNRALIGIASPAGSSPILNLQAMSAAEISQRLAWRVPRLEFTQTPLGEAIEMINKNGQDRLSLEDTSLESVRISGVLRADHIETLLHLLDTDYGIEAKRLPSGEIALTRRH